ncbi:MAG: isoleucine--tRNA ligase [Planctomycetota bacterium]|nr:isoleucine--tRNA ligase [Planctomycetota bacterium]
MTETTQEKRNYKKTLNLPKTSFPMKANLAQNESASQKRWDTMGLYDQTIKALDEANAPNFVFHDGPPYANGSIHVGHLLNKVLKDLVVRSRHLRGEQCRYIPGWDCHGLPIEHKVMKELMESGKADKINSLSEDNRRMAIRRECKKSASKYIKLQSGQMQKLLTMADYANPYLTMAPTYEKAVLEVFATMLEKGLVYRALKSVHWSIANETALAEAELEYQDKEDLSIFVNFQASDRDAIAKAFGVELEQTPSFMIWTTTPWTLPANLAIAVHKKFEYVLVEVDGTLMVIATDLVEKVTQRGGSGGAENVKTIATTQGVNLVGLKYDHPICDRQSPIVDADYVTLDDGTGLVHTAPGHGVDDYQTGLRVGLDIYCPVLGDGTYDETVPEFLRGMSIWDANSVITEHIRESGHLFHDHTFMHSYPHDWRSKTPVIFRATEQWFIHVDEKTKDGGDSLRTMALNATENDVQFVPQWGRNRMRGMLEQRPDWCISRQRSWGLPIPAFETSEGDTFMTTASVKAIAECFGTMGSDAWFTQPPEVLLASYDHSSDPDLPENLKGLDVSSLAKTYDIFDVWFESGSSWNAVMRQRGEARTDGPWTDLYLEGSDQHRGWFQLSMLPSLGATGKSPFGCLLTHGFMVDKDGKKMSKSGGNTLEVETLLKDFGADVCRWWVCSLAYENDIKVDPKFFTTAADSYRKVRNTLRFLLSNLADFEPCSDSNPNGMCVDLKSIAPNSIDAYVLNEGVKLQTACLESYGRYEFRKVHQMIYDFCNDTLSAFYCAAVKDRLYCDTAGSERRRITQTVMWDLLEILTRLLSPIMPHTADETYRALWSDDERCIHLQKAIDFDDLPEADADWAKVLEARDVALKALEEAKATGIENPLDAEVVFGDPEGVLKRFEADFADLLGVSRVRFDGEGEVKVNDLREEPRCERSWKRDGTVKERSDGGMLTDRDAEAVGV